MNSDVLSLPLKGGGQGGGEGFAIPQIQDCR